MLAACSGSGGHHRLNKHMRIYEISTLKPIKPMSPAQHRIYAKKRQVDQAREALKREKDAQKRQRELERRWNKLRKR